MLIRNLTNYNIEPLILEGVLDYPHEELKVEIKYCPSGTIRPISGTYYRRTPKLPDGRLIRLRINRDNRYPVRIPFKTSEYFKKRDVYGREVTYQKLRREDFSCAEHLLAAVFFHEFSHYLDHVEDLNGRYKQTKADRFAVDRLQLLGILR